METRPYKDPSEVPDSVPKAKKAQFMEVWNSAYKKAKEDGKNEKDAESSAFAQAWGVINKDAKAATMKREVRYMPGMELRASENGKILMGYAAKFDSWTDIGGMFRECIRKGCFANAIKEKQDVRALVNHNMDMVLGRTAAGTLRLSEDEIGLAFEIDLPDTQVGRDIRCLVTRGDISGCSFGFKAIDERWTDHQEPPSERELLAVDLFDISPATYPAYPDTELSVRALWPDGEPEEIERRKEKKTKRVDDEDLPASAFLIVGDPDKTETWKLPWKFSSEEKTKSHLRNALARFNQLEDVSKEEKDKAWAKLVRLCKQYDIDVDEGKSIDLADIERQLSALRLAAENEFSKTR